MVVTVRTPPSKGERHGIFPVSKQAQHPAALSAVLYDRAFLRAARQGPSRASTGCGKEYPQAPAAGRIFKGLLTVDRTDIPGVALGNTGAPEHTCFSPDRARWTRPSEQYP